ncbi:MAG: helix-turn-helix transcriptional regulator [Clostridia bacterium]|nr:helix-turn-helix transcriptional regulator [Clostridia bacterium]
MANKKEINQKSCIRLRELISDLEMTQSQFGDLLGLGARQISCMVNGVRRLTEDNARRIAQLFPKVRYEWLMGYDDYKTELEYKNSKLDEKLFELHKDIREYIELCGITDKIVSQIGYEFTNTSLAQLPEDEKRALRNEREFYRLCKIIKNPQNDIFRKLFSEEELRNIRDRLDSYDDCAYPGISRGERRELTDEEVEEYWRDRAENAEEIIEEQRAAVESFSKEMPEVHGYDPYCLCDKNGNIAAQFTYSETCSFIHQLHDVVEAMIIYYINKHKKED